MATKETKKSVRRIKAGTVIVMEYQGENKPCDKAMALLLTPIKLEDNKPYTGEFRTMYAIDTDKEQFIPSGPINDVTCRVAVATPRLKAWFYEQIVNLCKGETKSRPKVYVLTNHAACECEYLGTNNRVFAKKEDALKAFEDWKKDEMEYVKRYDWKICADDPEHFEACEEGDYAANHTEGFVNEYEVE